MTAAPTGAAPLRVGVLGCASVARRRLMPALAALPETELTAVASRDAGRAREFAALHGCRPVHGYAALLARDDIDAVYIPLPAALHGEWIAAALRAGKHVLAEKPLTTSAQRTAQLLAEARDRRLVLMENVMFLHHGQHAAVRGLVHTERVIGEPRFLRAVFAVPPRPADDIRYRADLGGGALWDVGVYPVRAALHLLGDGLTVCGAALSQAAGYEVDTSGAALLRTSTGVFAHLSFGLEQAYASTYELWGSEGRIVLDQAFTPPADHRPLVRLQRASGTEEIRLDAEDQVAATVRAWVAAVRSGTTPDIGTLRQAELLDEIRRHADG
ncbi:Gfo/Idh/MocA family oxidoreductase [Streptomyces sp. NPDC021622]|uniref:Gfo/Idh/MocA family protein n=1 Tax=Streptomyces sp. NPDC021622 TaxID=3155013 RepID=UPI0033D33BA7